MFTGAGHRTTIITFEEDASANDRVDELRKLGRLAEEVPVLNIYDWYRNSSTRNKQDAESSTRNYPSIKPAHIADAHPDPDFVEQGTDRHGRYVRHFSIDGEYIAFDRLDDNGTIDHINYFKNRVVYRRDDYIGVSLTKRTLYADNGEPNRIQFMTSDGFCFAQRWVNPESGKGEGVFVSERSTRTVQRFNGLPDWHVAWLQSIVDSEDSLPIVIAETASTIAKVEQLHHDSAVIIGMMHNSHVAAPFTKDAPLRPDYEKSFAELGELDALVVLTEEQKTDMQERLGHHDVFTVVPNAIRLPEGVSRLFTIEGVGRLRTSVGRAPRSAGRAGARWDSQLIDQGSESIPESPDPRTSKIPCGIAPLLFPAITGRVVTVSSNAHRLGSPEIRFDDLDRDKDYSPSGAYAQSKLANLLFTLELQRRLTAAGSLAGQWPRASVGRRPTCRAMPGTPCSAGSVP